MITAIKARQGVRSDLGDEVDTDMHLIAVGSRGAHENRPDKCGCRHLLSPVDTTVKEVSQGNVDDDDEDGNTEEEAGEDQVEIADQRFGRKRHLVPLPNGCMGDGLPCTIGALYRMASSSVKIASKIPGVIPSCSL